MEAVWRILSSPLSEFAFFPTKNKGKPRSILRIVLYTLQVSVYKVQEGAAADGNDLMRGVLLQDWQQHLQEPAGERPDTGGACRSGRLIPQDGAEDGGRAEGIPHGDGY